MNAVIDFLNTAGAWFTAFALPMLIQSSVLILLILGIDLLIRKKVRAVFRYGLWMLVLVKLMLPTSLSSPTGLGYWLGIPMPELRQQSEISIPPAQEPMPLLTENPLEPIYPEPFETIQIPSTVETMIYETPPINPLITESEQTATAIPALTSTAISAEPSPVITWQAIVLLVWLVIILVLALLLVQRVFFVRQLVSQSHDAKGSVNGVLRRCREKLGIHKTIPIKLSVNASSPSVCGLWRPVILFPHGLLQQLNRRELESVLLHELAHIKRRDLWVNLWQTILQILYFYHPLFWLANVLIRRVREQAVDEAVLVAMDREAEDYSNTLVRVFRMSLQRPALSLRLIGVVESKKSLATRIKHILNRPIPKKAKLGILGMLMVFVVGALLLPMAQANKISDASETLASGEENINPMEEDSWGEAVQGMQCRVRAEKPTWPQGSIPKLFADLRNRGQQNLRIVIGPESWALEINGQWHNSNIDWLGFRRHLPLGPGQLQRDMEVRIPTLDNPANQLQVLKPGKHTLRIACLLNDPWRPGDEVLRVVSNPIQIKIESVGKENDTWGDPVKGVQMRLHTEKKQWPVNDTPVLKVDMRNTGGNGFKKLVMYTDCWELEMDGQRYRTTVEPWGIARVLSFVPGTEHTGLVVPLWDHLGWESKDGNKPLQFLPGRHTIRVAFCMTGMQKSETNVYTRRGSEKWKERVVSRPIEIEILPVPAEEVSWSKGREGVQVRLRSAKRIWNQGDDPSFKVDIRNTGTRELKTSLLASLALEIDGKPYAPRAWWRLGTIGVMPFGPGKEYNLDIKLSQFAADRKAANELPPGLHTIKAVYLDNNSADGRGLTTSLSRYKEMALGYSDPVEISIILAEHKWGAPTNGLRAAVEFSPEKESYTQGESVAVRLHIQNVSDSDIEFKSVSTRQDYAQVKDKDGKDIKVQRRFHSGTVYTRSHTIKPTDVLVLKTTGLGFAEENQTLNEFKSKRGYFVGSILRSKPGTYAIHYNVNRDLKTGIRKVKIVEKPQIEAKQITMKEVVQTLARKYRARICFEDITDYDITEIAVVPYRLTGNFKAQTIPPLLDQITQSGPFAWVKYNDTYVVYPRKNSLLEFPASLNIDDSPLEFVARKVLDKIPAGKEMEIKSPVSVVPGVNKKGNVRHLWVSSSPARYSLSRAVEESGRGDTEIVWTFTKEQDRRRLTFHYLKTAIAIAESGETIVEKPRIKNNQVSRTNVKARNAREKRAANSSEGFISYRKLVQGLAEGEKRSKLAEGFQKFADKYPEAYDSKDAKELSILLTQMAREDEKFVKPDDVNALPEEQRIAYYVFKLRDVAEQSMIEPGNCNVLMFSRTPQSSAIALRKIGKPAVPVLIGLLDDRRPTRSHNTGFSGHHVVRYCDAALQILDVISGQRFTHFDNRDVLGGTGAFLSNAKPHDRNRITSRIKKWWEQNQHKSESEWIRDVLSRSRISMVGDRIEIARRLIELEGPDSVPFFRRQLKKEPNNAWVLTLLLEAAGKAALEDIRPMIRHRDFAMRKTAYEALVEAGEMEVIDKVVDELNLILKKIDSESNTGKDHADNPLHSNQDRVGSLAYILILSNQKDDVLTAARLIQHKDSRIADRVLFLFHTLLEQKDKPSGESRRVVVPYMASVLSNKELRGWAAGWLINALDLSFEFASVSYDAAPKHEMVKQRQEVYKQLEKWWNLHRHEYPSAR